MSTPSRTLWQMQDVAWWRRERIAALGAEFGPAGPAVMNLLECEAKTVNRAGHVRSGYTTIARGCYLDTLAGLQAGIELARRVIGRARELALLAGFAHEPGDLEFTATVATFADDQKRGRAASRQEDARGTGQLELDDDAPAADDVAAAEGTQSGASIDRPDTDRQTDVPAMPAADAAHAPAGRDAPEVVASLSRPVTHLSREEEEEGTAEREDRAQVLHPMHAEAMRALTAAAPGSFIEPASIDAALRAYPDLDATQVIRTAEVWLRDGRHRGSVPSALLQAGLQISSRRAAGDRPPRPWSRAPRPPRPGRPGRRDLDALRDQLRAADAADREASA